MRFLAAEPPGSHQLVPLCGDGYLNLVVIKFYYCSFSLDSAVSSALAVVLTLALAFYIVRRLKGPVPGKLQMVLEFLLSYTRGLVHENVGPDAAFVVPLAATIALYILIANWIGFLPLKEPFIPANADLNQTFAMAIVVFLLVQAYSLWVLGPVGFLRRFTKPLDGAIAFRVIFVPINVIEELAKPISLSLRLFGNIFAGLLMIYLLTQLPILISWIPVTAWKFFDVFFVGSIQAFIFMLLTIIYFQQAREGLEEEAHHPPPAPGAARTAGPVSN